MHLKDINCSLYLADRTLAHPYSGFGRDLYYELLPEYGREAFIRFETGIQGDVSPGDRKTYLLQIFQSSQPGRLIFETEIAVETGWGTIRRDFGIQLDDPTVPHSSHWIVVDICRTGLSTSPWPDARFTFNYKYQENSIRSTEALAFSNAQSSGHYSTSEFSEGSNSDLANVIIRKIGEQEREILRLKVPPSNTHLSL
ncbi:hypothetical protein ABW19_dt0209846 [Dactylella cylindrospora]|nr:hypothetical protein ABW19_dt0209846 [Dactylella cylindrospora]